MYKVKGKPWAYSGAIDVSDCATAKEIMLKAGLNFNVAKCELVGKMPIKLTGTDEELDRIIKEQKEGAHVFGTDIYRKCDNAFATYRTDYWIMPRSRKWRRNTIQANILALHISLMTLLVKILLFGKLLDFGEMVREYL